MLSTVLDGSLKDAETVLTEPHVGVWHLVSTVRGQLRPGVGDDTLLRATFPPGSVTGAPKVQAMKVISQLEASRRETYTGAIGIASPIAGLDLSVAIRTFEFVKGTVWIGAGGGIVADSDPVAELQEAITKATGPVAVIGATIEQPANPLLLRRRTPRALAHGCRPERAQGLLEMIRADHGRPVDLQAHLTRLANSMRELWSLPVPPLIQELILRSAQV